MQSLENRSFSAQARPPLLNRHRKQMDATARRGREVVFENAENGSLRTNAA